MQIQVNTDNIIQGDARLSEFVKTTIGSRLHRFGSHVTRIEVHLSDENAHKPGNADKKCVMEARPAGRKPMAVSHIGGNVEQAVTGAAERLERMLDDTFSKLSDIKRATPPDLE